MSISIISGSIDGFIFSTEKKFLEFLLKMTGNEKKLPTIYT